jgi:hypothetical protein
MKRKANPKSEPSNRRNFRKRVIVMIASAAVILLTATIAYARVHPVIDDKAVVAMINGEPLTYKEYRMSLNRNRAQVSGYFQTKYHADGGMSFWTTDFNGEVPLDKLKTDALAAMVKIKIPQLLAKQKGIVQNITYDSFRNNWDAENKRRADAKRNNRPFFGPEHYTESEYYEVVYSNMVGELKKAYQKEENFSDDELKHFYKSNLEQLFKIRDSIKIRKLTAFRKDAATIIQKIKDGIDSGMDLETASAPYKEEVRMEEQIFDAQSAHSDAMADPGLFAKVQPLQQDQVTDVFQENGAYWIVKCIERKTGGYQAFEDVKISIQSQLAAESYEQTVDSLIRHAEVVINSKVYDRIGEEEVM